MIYDANEQTPAFLWSKKKRRQSVRDSYSQTFLCIINLSESFALGWAHQHQAYMSSLAVYNFHQVVFN